MLKLIDIKALSEILSVKSSTLYQWVELGKIPHYKLNGAVRFNHSEILDWLSACKIEQVGYNTIEGRKPRKGGA
ncbi:MAG: helix-turn-helix domain-containing protein [Deltaproteobacteria bacterium]|jgi:excisionase family DNA binding protein|nr:helix-turn-helix domain-containing protein [Deltaproteobacteria bacterium]MCL5880240.1 helix-turn-helix domain-containing protein [Deltaproteobacteria bacterium]